MKLRNKKMLSLLLATAMVFTMNTSVFAEEISADVDAVTDESAVEEIADFAAVDEFDVEAEVAETTAASANSANAVAISADTVLSENLATVSENFGLVTAAKVKGATHTFVVEYDAAIAYEGLKADWSESKKVTNGKATGVDVSVYYADNATVSKDSVSMDDIWDVSANKLKTGWSEAAIAKNGVKIKSAKGATVEFDGSPLYVVNKSTYIQDIKLDKKDKDLAKEFKNAYKDVFKSVKKDKTNKVSANGVIDGKSESYAYTIAVYPAYAGNDTTAVKAIEDYNAAVKTANPKAVISIATLDFSKTKYKDGLPKKIVATLNSKKVTLKPTKKEGKYKGYEDTPYATDATIANPAGTSYVIADGNFFGNIYFTATSK